LAWGVPSTELPPIQEEIWQEPDEAPAPVDDGEDIAWEPPPAIGPDGRMPWLDGPPAPRGEIPDRPVRRGLLAIAAGVGLGLAVAAGQWLLS
jgi:hypothetical protein